MASFQVVAFNPDDFERVIYTASERQVHMQDANLKERISLTVGGVGLVLDPTDYPDGTKFLLLTKTDK